ncbi:MAG: hypothetical protein ACK47B_10710 [Armatimonadota bacterium]
MPTDHDLDRLVEWLGQAVLIRHEPIECPRIVHRKDKPAVITLPERLHGERWSVALLHELGHLFLSLGIGELLRQEADGDPKLLRLAERWRMIDEARAAEFVGAWFLPSWVVRAYRGHVRDLAELSGCEVEFVDKRVRSVAHYAPVYLSAAPRWSAYHHRHVMCDQAGQDPLVYVASRGSVQPLYHFPVTRRNAEQVAHQLARDLMALTVEEFDLRHRPFQCSGLQRVEVDLAAAAEQAQVAAGQWLGSTVYGARR